MSRVHDPFEGSTCRAALQSACRCFVGWSPTRGSGGTTALVQGCTSDLGIKKKKTNCLPVHQLPGFFTIKVNGNINFWARSARRAVRRAGGFPGQEGERKDTGESVGGAGRARKGHAQRHLLSAAARTPLSRRPYIFTHTGAVLRGQVYVWRRSSNLLHGVTRAQPASCILKTLAASRTACSSLPACISAAKNVDENSDKSGHCERRTRAGAGCACSGQHSARARVRVLGRPRHRA